MNPEGIIISPGPKTPDHAGISINLIKLASKKIPVLGICLGHQSIAQAYGALITRAKKASKKVGIVTGGGSGHLPVFTGYIGKGFLDACAIGSVFASPSVEQMVSAIKNADNGNGVLCVIGNYGGDVMNFEMACEMVEAQGISCLLYTSPSPRD